MSVTRQKSYVAKSSVFKLHHNSNWYVRTEVRQAWIDSILYPQFLHNENLKVLFGLHWITRKLPYFWVNKTDSLGFDIFVLAVVYLSCLSWYSTTTTKAHVRYLTQKHARTEHKQFRGDIVVLAECELTAVVSFQCAWYVNKDVQRIFYNPATKKIHL